MGKADSGLQIQVGTGPKDREAEAALIRRKNLKRTGFPHDSAKVPGGRQYTVPAPEHIDADNDRQKPTATKSVRSAAPG